MAFTRHWLFRMSKNSSNKIRNANLPWCITKSFLCYSIKITRSDKMYLTVKPYPQWHWYFGSTVLSWVHRYYVPLSPALKKYWLDIVIFFESVYNNTIIDSVFVTSGSNEGFSWCLPDIDYFECQKTHPITVRNAHVPWCITKSFLCWSIKI